MPTAVAIEFDRQGVRAAAVDGDSLRLGRVDRAEIQSADGLAAALREALPGLRWSRATVTAVAGGDQLRCRLLRLPPCPDGELPDMVRMQASREFALADDAVIDFVPLATEPGGPRAVLAATIDHPSLDLLKGATQSLDAALDHVTARGAAAAQLATQVDPSLNQGAHLLACLSAGGADLIVVESGAPSLLRSTRLSEDAGADAVLAEARRTAAMAAQQTGRKIESTRLMGFPGAPDAVDVLAYLEGGYQVAPEGDTNPAELLGVAAAAISESRSLAPVLDFLNPRRPVVDNSGKRRQVLLAAAAAAVVLLGVFWDYARVQKVKQEIAAQEAILDQKEKSLEQWAPVREKAAAIEAWLATDVNWLDEIERLGRKLRPAPLTADEFPEQTDAYLTQFTATRATQRDQTGGRIDLRAVSRTPYSYDEVEQRLRDDRHEVETAQGALGPRGAKYRWETQTSLRVSQPAEEAAP